MITIAEKILTEAGDLEMYADQLTVLDDVDDIKDHLLEVKERLVDIYWALRNEWEAAELEVSEEYPDD